MENLPAIRAVHPILSAECGQIISVNDVSLLISSKLESRLLVIATAGVFIIKKASFLKGLSVENSFPFSVMSHIKIERQFITISKPSLSIQFTHADQLMIACAIVSTRCTLYDPKVVPLNISIAMSLQAQFQSLNFDYSTQSKLADKFLSSLLSVNANLIKEKIEETYLYLSKIKEELLFNDQFISLPYLPQTISALQNEKSITKLVVSELNSAAAIKVFASLIMTNTFIQSVTMNQVAIRGDLNPLSEALSMPNIVIDEWVFNNCGFDSEDFKLFIECFRNYKTNIKVLVFNTCTFTQSTFSYFTQRFFFIDCFHSLESFYFSDIIFSKEVLFFLCQLFASDWVLKNKTLKNLIIPRCFVELDALFNQLQNFETGITTADFSGNLFINSISGDLASKLSPHINILLNDCGFGQESFISLMQVLSLHRGHTMRLELCRALMTNQVRTQFYQLCPSLNFKSLVSLAWDGNIIDKNFFLFIQNQPRLSRISISDCIIAESAEIIYPEMSKVFASKPLTTVIIKATKPQFVLGSQFAPLIHTLLKRKSICDLDITGQQVGEDALIQIIDNLPMVMKNFRFCGNNIHHSEKLFSILNSILKKRLLFASWPEQDVEKILISTNPIYRTEFKSNIEVLKQQFDQRFIPPPSIDSPIDFIHNIKNNFKEAPQSNEAKPQITYGFEGRHVAADMILKFRVNDDSISNLLTECNSLEGKDPMVSMLEFMEAETSISKLSEVIQSGLHDSSSSEPFISARIE